MKMKCLALAGFVVGLLSVQGSVLAAGNGYVDVGQVLASSAAYRNMQQKLADTHASMDKDFVAQSKSMTEQEKNALAEKFTQVFRAEEEKLAQSFNEKLRQAIAKAAKEKGLDFVVDARVAMYGGTDITKEVQANLK